MVSLLCVRGNILGVARGFVFPSIISNLFFMACFILFFLVMQTEKRHCLWLLTARFCMQRSEILTCLGGKRKEKNWMG